MFGGMGTRWKSSHGMCVELDNACGDPHGEEEKDGKSYRKTCQKRLPGGPVAKIPHSQCREPRFDPWSGN